MSTRADDEQELHPAGDQHRQELGPIAIELAAERATAEGLLDWLDWRQPKLSK